MCQLCACCGGLGRGMNICQGCAALQHELPADASRREGLLLRQLRSMGARLDCVNCPCCIRITAGCVVRLCMVCALPWRVACKHTCYPIELIACSGGADKASTCLPAPPHPSCLLCLLQRPTCHPTALPLGPFLLFIRCIIALQPPPCKSRAIFYHPCWGIPGDASVRGGTAHTPSGCRLSTNSRACIRSNPGLSRAGRSTGRRSLPLGRMSCARDRG